jgi:hypothetical protein
MVWKIDLDEDAQVVVMSFDGVILLAELRRAQRVLIS